MRASLLVLVMVTVGCLETTMERSGAETWADPMLIDTGSYPHATVNTEDTGLFVDDGEPVPRFADTVVDAPGASDAPFRDPALAVNGVRGGGKGSGSMDVFSLGYRPGLDDTLTVRWSGARVADGDGDDLMVFENPFRYADDAWFMDLVIVEVSPDGESWAAFPVDYVAPDESVYIPDRSLWQGFAGRTPVWLHEDTFAVDPFFPKMAGGDGFDFAALPEGEVRDAILRDGALEVRFRSAATVTNPDTGAPFVRDPVSNGPDIDGVYARYLIPVR